MISRYATEISKIFKNAFIKSLHESFRADFMTKEEAKRILAVKSEPYELKHLEDTYKNLIEINKVENGGSKYIQDKIKTAYKMLISDKINL